MERAINESYYFIFVNISGGEMTVPRVYKSTYIDYSSERFYPCWSQLGFQVGLVSVWME